jgi:hypothetical protein
LCDDSEYDYYLVKATSSSIELREGESDKWGVYYSAGSKVIRGSYFQSKHDTPLTYTLIKRKPALVPSLSVLYLCFDLVIDDGTVILSGDMHQTIPKCVSECDYVR